MSLDYAGVDAAILNEETPPGSKPILRPEPIIKVDQLTYLIWDVSDLDKQESFLHDFGMVTHQKGYDSLFMRGYDSAPYIYLGRKAKKSAFKGLGLSVNSRQELVTLAKKTNNKIVAIDRPGGGEMVCLNDPNGIEVQVCFGIEQLEPLETRREILPANAPENRPRVNAGQRTPMMPSPIFKLGHCVLGSNKLDETVQWYMLHFGLLATDALCISDGSPAIVFLRPNRGSELSDHHTIVIGKGGSAGYQHSAYEVLDVDSVAQGQQYLKMKKREHVWGIGRHILGSQIFDYWHDVSGFEFEHYADGDVFTDEKQTDYYPLDSGNVYAWGDDIPPSFFALNRKQIWNVVQGLVKGDMTLPWLKQAKKAISRPARPWL